MLLENKKRKQESFLVDCEGANPQEGSIDKEALNEILSNPLITILSKKWIKIRNEHWDGFGQDKTGEVSEKWYLVLELEEKSL